MSPPYFDLAQITGDADDPVTGFQPTITTIAFGPVFVPTITDIQFTPDTVTLPNGTVVLVQTTEDWEGKTLT